MNKRFFVGTPVIKGCLRKSFTNKFSDITTSHQVRPSLSPPGYHGEDPCQKDG